MHIRASGGWNSAGSCETQRLRYACRWTGSLGQRATKAGPGRPIWLRSLAEIKTSARSAQVWLKTISSLCRDPTYTVLSRHVDCGRTEAAGAAPGDRLGGDGGENTGGGQGHPDHFV